MEKRRLNCPNQMASYSSAGGFAYHHFARRMARISRKTKQLVLLMSISKWAAARLKTFVWRQ